MIVAKLTWPFLGYYGPQSGITFDGAHELDDYAETEDEMYGAMKYAGNVDRFDIADNENIDRHTGVSEIAEYWKAARRIVNGDVFTGRFNGYQYCVGKDGKEWFVIAYVGADLLEKRGSVLECAEIIPIIKEAYKD